MLDCGCTYLCKVHGLEEDTSPVRLDDADVHMSMAGEG